MSQQNLDVAKSDKKVWLFKVPTYLKEHWQQACEASKRDGRLGDSMLGEELGEIILKYVGEDGGGAPQCQLMLNNPVASGRQKIPLKYEMKQQSEIQCMHLFKESKDGISVDGIVEHKFDLQPVRDAKQGGLTSGVLAMNKVASEDSKAPRIQVMNNKLHVRQPLAIAAMIPRRKQRAQAEKTKRLRMDKDQLENLLFELFEKQSMWRLQDLMKETDQPHTWLKQVLNDIAMLNTRGEHKDLWELKPEYKTQGMDVDEEKQKEKTEDKMDEDKDMPEKWDDIDP